MITEEAVIETLRNVVDPELGISIVDLGLVYKVEVGESSIGVDFTLTYPGCPAEEMLRRDIVETLRDVYGILDVKARTVWTPLWQPERMSEEARVALGYPI